MCLNICPLYSPGGCARSVSPVSQKRPLLMFLSGVRSRGTLIARASELRPQRRRSAAVDSPPLVSQQSSL
eukprot:6209677-Pleurochrysis_carterae.AAC.2